MGLHGGTAYSPERLEKLLKHAKITQQSIQEVSHWMLENRAFLSEMVEVWAQQLQVSSANQQIVSLYIANDAMQVGARKYGKQIAEAFEQKLLEVATFIMQSCDEKVKRILMKIVGIWKERKIVNAALLVMLQNVCAGKPPVDPETLKAAMEMPGETKDAKALREEFIKLMVKDDSVEHVLEQMPEVVESEVTTNMANKLQDLVSATISADLLSDRMFQLQSSLNNFHQAVEAFSEQGPTGENTSAGDIVWELMEPQVFELDIDRSRDHVQQYRGMLEQQTATREQLIECVEALERTDLFPETVYVTPMSAHIEQCEKLEKLYHICAEAEEMDAKRKAERQEKIMSSRHRYSDPTHASPRTSSFSDHRYNTSQYVPSSTAPLAYNASQYASSTTAPAPTRSNSYGGGYPISHSYEEPGQYNSNYGQQQNHHQGLQRRHSSSDAFSSSYQEPDRFKRPKLHHSHSQELVDQNRWQPRYAEPVIEQQVPRGGSGGHEDSYSPRYNDYNRYSPGPAPPREYNGRRSRWDDRPDDRDRRW